MDMSFKDSLAALGLDNEATGSPHFGGDRGGGFPTIPIGWSGSYREDKTSTTFTPGHTQWVPGTPRIFLGTVRREGSPINAPSGGFGVQPACLSALSSFPGGPTGISPDDVGRYSHRCSSPLSTVDFVSPSNYMYMGVPPIYGEHPTTMLRSPVDLAQGLVTVPMLTVSPSILQGALCTPMPLSIILEEREKGLE